MLESFAPGWPGVPARWTSSAKSGVGTSLGHASRLWFTLSHGILNEVYSPRVDQACTRDLGLIVTDGAEFFSEEKRHTRHEIATASDGVPAFRLTNTCLQDRYRIEKEVIADPRRQVLLQRIRFVPLIGKLSDYRLYLLLAPHLGNAGAGNTGWLGEHKGAPMLFAERARTALALHCSIAWRSRSVGFVGASDGWRELAAHKRLVTTYRRAENGTIALTGEVELAACGGSFVVALGFGNSSSEAAHRACASQLDGYDSALSRYLREWEDWQSTLIPNQPPRAGRDLYRTSTAVLRTHESKGFAGGIIASLSIPWGASKGDGDLGGYHLAWPRDLVESAGGLLAAGAHDDARRVLRYLAVTQEADGHWPQNMWLDGTPYWNGVQMDETALPILLVDLAWREGALRRDQLDKLWPMARAAAGFVVRNGPVTQEDRWEEDSGYSPFTLAAEIAALLAAADLAELQAEHAAAAYLRETADVWNGSIESWTYAEGGALAKQASAEGYYVRIAPPERADAGSPTLGFVPIKNRPPEKDRAEAAQMVSPDALALVRFGLRSAHDPRIVDTVRVIDHLLKVDTPAGPLWHRYNGDGYGEHQDGSPFDGTGVGRGWPLLTAERAHYELAAGRAAQAEALLATLSGFANEGGLIPEQVWDAPDLPARELYFGRPSGSAMPLVWAHAEYVKLCRSLRDGRVFDLPPQPVQRYQRDKVTAPRAAWRFNNKCASIPQGKRLRIETLAPAMVHWSADGWATVSDLETRDTHLGVHLVDLPTHSLKEGSQVLFTFLWRPGDRWERVDFKVSIAAKGSAR